MKTIYVATLATLAAVGTLACSTGETGSQTDLGAAEQELYGTPGSFWTGSPPMIPVCFEPGSSGSAYSAPRQWLMDELSRSIQRYARVNFVQQPAACTSGQAGIHTYVSTTLPGGFAKGIGDEISGINEGVRVSDCGYISGSSNAPWGFLTDAWGSAKAKEQCIRKVGLHEFGHALGFSHEEQSPEMNGITLVGANGATCSGPPSDAIPGGAHYGGYQRMSFMSVCGGLGPSEIDYWDDVIEPSDIAALQRAYGRRIPGTLIASSGRCAASVASAPGDISFLWDCDEFADDQEWVYDPSLRTLRVASTDLCLYTYLAQTMVGTCPSTANSAYQWTFADTYVRGWGGLCLDLNGGNTNGGSVQSWSCGALGGANQKWTISTTGEIRFGSTSYCLTASTTSSSMTVSACTGSALQKFDFASVPGHIKIVGLTNKCVDISAPFDSDYVDGADYETSADVPHNGAPVQSYTCTTSQYNQKWNFSGRIKHGFSGECLQRGSTANGATMTVEPCSTSDDQVWDYYPR